MNINDNNRSKTKRLKIKLKLIKWSYEIQEAIVSHPNKRLIFSDNV